MIFNYNNRKIYYAVFCDLQKNLNFINKVAFINKYDFLI